MKYKHSLVGILIVAGTLGLGLKSQNVTANAKYINDPNIIGVKDTHSVDDDIPADAVEISDAASFKAYFDGTGKSTNKYGYLTSNIDLGGYTFPDVGMAGEFSSTFDGRGYKVFNYTAGRALFNLGSASSVIKNINLEFTNNGISGHGGLIYQTNGLVTDSTISMTLTEAFNTFGGVALPAVSGTFKNLHTNWTFTGPSVSSNNLYPIVQDDATANIENCTYWIVDGSTASFQTSNSNIKLKEMEDKTKPSISITSDKTSVAIDDEDLTFTITGELKYTNEEAELELVVVEGDGFIQEVNGSNPFVIDVEPVVGEIVVKLTATVGDELLESEEITLIILGANIEIPDDAVELRTKADLKSYFTGTEKNNINAVLMNDIDMEGEAIGGKGGEFSAIVEGLNHKISNTVNGELFHIIGTSGVVRNLDIQVINNGAGDGVFGHANHGTIKNVNIDVTLNKTRSNFGGIVMWGNGTFENIHVDWHIEGYLGLKSHILFKTVRDANSNPNLSGLSYTIHSGFESQFLPYVTAAVVDIPVHTSLQEQEAKTFAAYILGYEGGDVVTDNCAKNFTEAKEIYNKLGAASKTELSTNSDVNVQEAFQRYSHWALINNAKLDGTSLSSTSKTRGVANNNSLGLVTLIALIGLTAIGGYYFINKKNIIKRKD